MKRKAIQLANQTIVISLPSKWVKQQGIKKGDEINVEERGKELIISGRREGEEKRVEVDISGLDDRVIGWFISSLYKLGYDEILLKYNRASSIKKVEGTIRNVLTGFIISEQSENRCIIKSISKDMVSEFSTGLRRAFLVTIAMAESCLEMIKNNKFDSLKDLITLERTNTQLTNFCERILTKYTYKEESKAYSAYVINWNLETICDEYKHICQYLTSNKKRKIKISKIVLKLFERVNEYFKEYYSLLYSFDVKILNILSDKEKKIIEDIEKEYQDKNIEELLVMGCLLNIIVKTGEFATAIISFNFNGDSK